MEKRVDSYCNKDQSAVNHPEHSRALPYGAISLHDGHGLKFTTIYNAEHQTGKKYKALGATDIPQHMNAACDI
jgi:hypothetical protein